MYTKPPGSIANAAWNLCIVMPSRGNYLCSQDLLFYMYPRFVDEQLQSCRGSDACASMKVWEVLHSQCQRVMMDGLCLSKEEIR